MAVDAGTIYSEVRIELDKLKGDIRKTRTEFDKFGKSNQRQARKVQKSWTDKFKQINLAGVAAFAGIGVALKKAITQFADFEQAMANVQSVARATPEEFRRLEEAAQQAGETTAFSATESANALYSLASAGLDAKESAAALDGVLQLAGATQSDLTDTSASVAAALSQFGLDASEATDVSNTFAAAIANSQANMTKLSNAMRQVGPVAGTLGISIEETTGALQALFDAGFRGEQAGTALRNILSSLANESDATVKKLNDLGVAFEDVDPAANSLTDVIGTLAEAGLETGQVLDAFGREAGPQLLTLLQTGEQGLKDYTAAVTDTNAASEAYEIQMDTMQGSLAELSSATESAAITFISEFAPAIRAVIESLTSLIRFISDIPGPLKVMLGLFTGGVATVAGFTTALSVLGVTAGVALGPITAIVAAASALTAGFIAVKGAIGNVKLGDLRGEVEGIASELDLTQQKAKEFAINLKAIGANKDNLDGIISGIKQIKQEFGLSIDVIEEANQKFLTLREIGVSTADAVDNLKREYGLTEEEVFAVLEVNEELSKETENALETQQEKTKEQKEFVKQLSREVTRRDAVRQLAQGNEKLAQSALNFLKKQDEQLNKNEDRVIDKIQAELDLEEEVNNLQELKNEGGITEAELTERSNSLRKNIRDNLIESVQAGEELTEGQWHLLGAINEFLGVQKETVEESENLSDSFEEIETNIYSGIDALEKYHDESKATYTDISDQTESYEMELLRLVGTEEEVIEAERDRAIAAARASGGSIDAINRQIDAINRLYDEMLNRARESTEEQKTLFREFLDSVRETEADWQDYFDVVTNGFTNLVSSIDSLVQASADNQIEEINRVLDAQLSTINRLEQNRIDSIDRQLQKELEAAGVAEETRLESLERQLEEAKESGDKETEARLEDEITRLEIIQKYEKEKTKTEEEAEAERIEATEEAEQEKAQIQYEANIAAWRSKLAIALADAARAIITGYAQLGPIAGSIAAATTGVATGIQIAAMRQAKPEEPDFATGGIVNPIRDNINNIQSRSNKPEFQTGGIMVPSGSDGRQITVAENGSPELMLNSGGEGAALLDEFANRIVRAMGTQRGGGGIMNVQLSVDGRKIAENTVDYINNGQIRVKV